jgi:hypothetical protein
MKKSKLLTITTIMALATVATSVTVFAQSANGTKAVNAKIQATQVSQKGHNVKPVNKMKTALDTLVGNNTITQDQETAIINALIPKAHVGTHIGATVRPYVHTEASTVKVSATERVAPEQRAKTALDNLVQAGTITQSQEDAVINALKQAMPQHNGDMHKNGFKTALDTLVSGSIITADQETAIINALKPQAPVENEGTVPTEKVSRTDRAKTALDGLVQAGTITQAQEDAVVSALTQVIVQHHQGHAHGDQAPTDSVQ